MSCCVTSYVVCRAGVSFVGREDDELRVEGRYVGLEDGYKRCLVGEKERG